MTTSVVRGAPSETTVITGAGGWLGRCLVNAFADPGSPLHRSGSLRLLLAHDGERAGVELALGAASAHIVVGDITDGRTVEELVGVEGASVIHAAAVIHPARATDFDRVNHGGTATVVEACSKAGVKRLVHVSSNSPFGANPTQEDTFRANEPYNPYMGYGRSKMNAELAVLDAARRGDLDAVVVRPPWFYGPRQPARQTSFFRLVRRGLFPLLGDGRNRRSMVYVDNLIDGIDAADRVEAASGQALWVADERPYEMNEVIAAVRAALTVCGIPPVRPQTRVPAVLGAMARTADRVLQDRGRYVQGVHVLGEMDLTIACDITHTKAVLGYEPQVELVEGMVRSVAWCLEQGFDL